MDLSIYVTNFIETRKTFCGRTDVWTDVHTDGHFRPPLMLLGRLGGIDLKTKPRFGRFLRPPAWKQSGTILVEINVNCFYCCKII